LKTKILIKYDKPHTLYYKPLLIPDLKEMSGEEFKTIMNIKVGKKLQPNAYLMIEKEGILADSI